MLSGHETSVGSTEVTATGRSVVELVLRKSGRYKKSRLPERQEAFAVDAGWSVTFPGPRRHSETELEAKTHFARVARFLFVFCDRA